MALRIRTRRSSADLRLSLLFVGLIVLGACGPRGGLSDRYVAERLAWQAMKLSRAMRSNPQLATVGMREHLAEKYREIVRTFPPPSGASSLSEVERDVAGITGQARSKLALMALDAGDVDQAVRLYESIRDSYSFDPALAMDGAFALAGVYEGADRWEDAVSAYEDVIERWLASESAGGETDLLLLRVPTKIAVGHRLRNGAPAARPWFESARQRYNSWAARWPGSPVEEIATELFAETFALEGRWAEAIAAYEEFDRVHGTPSNRDRVWMTLAELYETRTLEVDRADEYYARIAEAYADDSAGGTAVIALAVHDMDRGNHERARERLADVVSRFRDEGALGATALHYLALSYEREGKWHSAVPEFNRLAAEYPTTMYGLSALLHVAEYFLDAGEAEAAATALERAADHYERIVRDYAGTPAELAARNYLIETRTRQEMWLEAADALVEAAGRYPDSPTSVRMMLSAAELYEQKLGNADRAREILENVRSLEEGGPADEALEDSGRPSGE